MNLKKILRPAWEAIKLYGLPFLSVQVCAVALVVSYYRFEGLQKFCEQISVWKTEGGFIFSIWTCVVAAALIPEIIKAIFGKIKFPLTKAYWKDLSFVAFYYGISGLQVDILYRTQGWIFGNELIFSTLGKKVLVDMLVWNPFFSAPFCALFFAWRVNRFRPVVTLKQFDWEFYRERCLPLLFPTWLYWFPVVSCIYSMPPTLQLPLFLCAIIAWSMLQIFIVKRGADENKVSDRTVLQSEGRVGKLDEFAGSR